MQDGRSFGRRHRDRPDQRRRGVARHAAFHATGCAGAHGRAARRRSHTDAGRYSPFSRTRPFAQKVGRLRETLGEALKAQAFERLRALIEAVVLTPEDGDLAIDLRGELASMLSLCAGAETQKASAAVTGEALQIKLVAGTGFEPVTFRL